MHPLLKRIGRNRQHYGVGDGRRQKRNIVALHDYSFKQSSLVYMHGCPHVFLYFCLVVCYTPTRHQQQHMKQLKQKSAKKKKRYTMLANSTFWSFSTVHQVKRCSQISSQEEKRNNATRVESWRSVGNSLSHVISFSYITCIPKKFSLIVATAQTRNTTTTFLHFIVIVYKRNQTGKSVMLK